MSNNEATLKRLKDTIERLKTEKAQAEGSRDTVFNSIKKDFGVKTMDEAYNELKVMSDQIDVMKEQQEELLNIAEEKLRDYK